MHPRVAELIAALDLQPHPEGGFYRQIFRSEVQSPRWIDAVYVLR
jgi:predicted cupin superfamily sugar epimerase